MPTNEELQRIYDERTGIVPVHPRTLDGLRAVYEAGVAAERGRAFAEAADFLRDAARTAAQAQREHDIAEGLPIIGTSTANETEWYQIGNWAHSMLAAHLARENATTPDPARGAFSPVEYELLTGEIREARADREPEPTTEVWHVGRSWHGHPLEDTCPCPKASCGLAIVADRINDSTCPQHGSDAAQTIRQAHRAAECPAAHTEHVTVTDARDYDCLEGECEHVDEDGQPEDMSACPVLTLEVCVDCMAEHERGRNPEGWGDLPLATWPCASTAAPATEEGSNRG